MSAAEEAAKRVAAGLRLAELARELASELAPLVPDDLALLFVLIPRRPAARTFVASSIPGMGQDVLASVLGQIAEAIAKNEGVTLTELLPTSLQGTKH